MVIPCSTFLKLRAIGLAALSYLLLTFGSSGDKEVLTRPSTGNDMPASMCSRGLPHCGFDDVLTRPWTYDDSLTSMCSRCLPKNSIEEVPSRPWTCNHAPTSMCSRGFVQHFSYATYGIDFAPRPATTDGEAINPAPPAKTDTQKLILKSITRAEAIGDCALAMFLRSFWAVDDGGAFTLPPPQQG